MVKLKMKYFVIKLTRKFDLDTIVLRLQEIGMVNRETVYGGELAHILLLAQLSKENE